MEPKKTSRKFNKEGVRDYLLARATQKAKDAWQYRNDARKSKTAGLDAVHDADKRLAVLSHTSAYEDLAIAHKLGLITRDEYLQLSNKVDAIAFNGID